VQGQLWLQGNSTNASQKSPPENDIFSHLLDPKDEHVPLHLNADARLVIVAGSDTTASTLTWVFYELVKNPELFKRLQKAIDEAVGDKELLDCDDLKDIPLLDGVINETLRLHPAVPSGVQRETPPEGLTIGDKYIPGNIIIWQPIHTIQRDERYFKSATTFYPERWYEANQDEWIKDKRAFIPFSYGSYKCIGNNLAMMEMRAVAANIVHKFDVSKAPGEDFDAIENKTMDTFTLTLGKLEVVLSKRNARRDSGA
jgi:cytochrome P450